MHYWKNKMRK